MHRKVIFIINPISGTQTKSGIRLLVENSLAAANIPCLVFPSVASGDYIFLKDIIQEKNITDVLIAGGDGTVSQVIGSLLDVHVNFGIIPCGSGNGLALAANIPAQPAKAIDAFIKGKPVRTDGFRVNGKFACMLCGLGFDAKVAHDFANQPKRGLTTYINQVIKNFFSATTYSFEIKFGKRLIETEAFFISVANSNQFGNNFTIAPQASLSDGLLDVVIVTNQNKMSVLIQTLIQVTGWNKLEDQTFTAGKKGVIYFQTDKLTIYNKSNAPLHMDGDPAETADEFNFEIIPHCFSLIQPLKAQA